MYVAGSLAKMYTLNFANQCKESKADEELEGSTCCNRAVDLLINIH